MTHHARQRRLNEFPSYKGGDTIVVDGYVLEYAPHHHLANFWGYVQQHRLVMEDKLGRPLQPKTEAVHHVDHCRSNNHPDNLELMDRNEHIAMHGRGMREKNMRRLPRGKVVAALNGRSLKEAARQLGCCTETLRNRYPDLLAPRKRRSPTNIDNPRDLERVAAAATDPRISVHQAAADLHMSPRTILRICERHKIPWIAKSRVGEKRKQYRRHRNQRRPNGYWPDDDTIAAILAAAVDANVKQDELLDRLGISTPTLTKVLHKYGVTWVRHNKRPSLRASAIYASRLAPETQ